STYGPAETKRMVRNVTTGRNRKIRSLALETFWSRGAMCWGERQAVRYLFRPAPDAPPAPEPSETDPGYLSNELAQRLGAGNIRSELSLQRFVDAKLTPIEDTSIEWTEMAAPPVKVADLRFGKPKAAIAEVIADARRIDELAFNPWNTS